MIVTRELSEIYLHRLDCMYCTYYICKKSTAYSYSAKTVNLPPRPEPHNYGTAAYSTKLCAIGCEEAIESNEIYHNGFQSFSSTGAIELHTMPATTPVAESSYTAGSTSFSPVLSHELIRSSGSRRTATN